MTGPGPARRLLPLHAQQRPRRGRRFHRAIPKSCTRICAQAPARPPSRSSFCTTRLPSAAALASAATSKLHRPSRWEGRRLCLGWRPVTVADRARRRPRSQPRAGVRPHLRLSLRARPPFMHPRLAGSPGWACSAATPGSRTPSGPTCAPTRPCPRATTCAAGGCDCLGLIVGGGYGCVCVGGVVERGVGRCAEGSLCRPMSATPTLRHTPPPRAPCSSHPQPTRLTPHPPCPRPRT